MHTEDPLCLARRAKRALLLNALRQAVLKREARRAWSGRDGVLCSGGAERADRNGSVRQRWNGTADGTAF